MTHSASRAPALLIGGFVVFVAVLIALVAASLARRRVAEFEPSPTVTATTAETFTLDTVTVDARDPAAWRFVSFRRGGVLPAGDTAGWDLAFRRFQVIASGAIADAGPVAFEQVHQAPAGGYVTTHTGRDTVNAAIARWYRYSFVTHLLHPLNRVYVVRTTAQRYAKLEFLGYYCHGTAPGCVTVRYAYQPSGDRTLR